MFSVTVFIFPSQDLLFFFPIYQLMEGREGIPYFVLPVCAGLL